MIRNTILLAALIVAGALPATELAAQQVLSATSETGDMMTTHIAGPQRQSGWWEFSELAENGDELAKTQLCVGARSEAVYSAFDQISGETCTSKRFEETAEGYVYTTVCGVPGMPEVTTTGVLTGDIATAYTMDETKDIGAGGDRIRRTAKLLAPQCPDGYADGDEARMGGLLKSSVLLGR